MDPDQTSQSLDEKKIIILCEKCSQKLRIPLPEANKKLIVTCPKCRHSFEYEQKANLGPSVAGSRFSVVKTGDDVTPTLLTRIMEHSRGQVLVLGYGADKELIRSTLGSDWDIIVPTYAATWEQNQMGLMEYARLMQEDATRARVGIFNAPPDYVDANLFKPSRTGPYSASIYFLGLSDSPLRDVEAFKAILFRSHILTPWVECIFRTDENKLRIAEQKELNEAILTKTSLDELVPRILRNLQTEMDAIKSKQFQNNVKKIKKPWEFWK